jgi:hypothetical protein
MGEWLMQLGEADFPSYEDRQSERLLKPYKIYGYCLRQFVRCFKPLIAH